MFVEAHRIEEGGLFQAAMIEEVRFAEDSPLEEAVSSEPVSEAENQIRAL